MKVKFLSWLLVAALALSVCGVSLAEDSAVSIDFEDGVFGFVGMAMDAGNADESVLSVVDYNGSKALKVDIQNKVPYVAFELSGLLGADVEKVRKITMDIGTELGDEKFYATSGRIYAYTGAELVKTFDEWSVYMEKSNPKTAVSAIADDELFVADAGNYIVVSKEVDNYVTKTAGAPLDMYIDNVCFYDAEGNLMTVDKTAQFVARTSGPDWSGISVMGAETEIGGAGSGGAWAQAADINTVAAGGTFDPATLEAGDIVTIYFAGEGNIWLVGVSDGNANGDWIRIADGGNAPINGSHNMAQVSYEQIVAALGEDFAATLQRLQCESDMDWEVQKVTVGKAADVLYGMANVSELGGAGTGGAWAQGADVYTVAGGGEFDPATIVAGTVFNVNYVGDGECWLVFVSDGNPNGDWVRVGDGGGSLNYNGNAQITYDMIVAMLGEDFASTLQRIQVESDMDWESYSVTFGSAVAPYVEAVDQMELGGAGTGGAWGQGADIHTVADGGTFDPATIVPGSVLTVNFASEGNMWVVFCSSGNPNGDWLRIADGGFASKNASGDKVQITYDQIVAVAGEDFAATLARIQCESDMDWESYSVTLGTAAQ